MRRSVRGSHQQGSLKTDECGIQGGRLTISPPLAIFDLVYESLVLLLAGSSLEAGASERLNPAGTDPKKPEGIVTGVVASRRARGDRIELWLGGREERTPPPNEWIEQLKDTLGDELDMPDVRPLLSRSNVWRLMGRESAQEGKIQATFLVQCSRPPSSETQDVHANQRIPGCACKPAYSPRLWLHSFRTT